MRSKFLSAAFESAAKSAKSGGTSDLKSGKLLCDISAGCLNQYEERYWDGRAFHGWEFDGRSKNAILPARNARVAETE